MIRIALLFVMAFCTAHAFADQTPGTPGPLGNEHDDISFRCTFRSHLDENLGKGGGIWRRCSASGQFDARDIDNDGREDDFLRITCGDGDNDSDDVVVYRDGIRTRLVKDLDNDEAGKRVDLLIEGRRAPWGSGRAVPEILAEDFNPKHVNGTNRSSLRFHDANGKQHALRGECTFSRKEPGRIY